MLQSRESSTALLGLRGFYFLTYAGMGALFPFLSLLLQAHRLSPTETSWVMVAIPLGNLLVPPLWGIAADVLRARLLLLRVACLGSGLCMLLFLPRWQLAGWLVSMGLFAFFRSPVSALTDASTVDALGGRDVGFSRIRLWGSVGFAVAALGIGQLGPTSHPDRLVVTTAAIYFCAVLSTLPLRARSSPNPTPVREGHVAQRLGPLLLEPRFLLFLLGSALHYLGHSTYDAYFGLYARGLGLGDALVGAAWAVGVAAEIGVMIVSPWLLGRVSATALLCIGSAAAVVRWLLLSVTTGTIELVVLQALHGLTFGLWFVSAVSFVQSRAPRELRTSLQSAAYSALGLGTVAGYLGGGWVLEHHGGALLFRLAAGAAGAGLLCYLGTTLLPGPKSPPAVVPAR